MLLKNTKIPKGTKELENPGKSRVLMYKTEIFFPEKASVEREKHRDGPGGAGKGKELKSSIPSPHPVPWWSQ